MNIKHTQSGNSIAANNVSFRDHAANRPRKICSLLKLPGFTPGEVCLGIVSVMDLGAQSASGLTSVVEKALDYAGLPHNNKPRMCAWLCEEVQAFYKSTPHLTRWVGFSTTMIKHDGKAPKFKANKSSIASNLMRRIPKTCATRSTQQVL